jgi:hypothetical protein
MHAGDKRRRILLSESLKISIKQQWGRSSSEEEADLGSRQAHISGELKLLDAALSQEVQRLRQDDPGSVQRWADLHIGLRDALLAQEDLAAVAKGVAEAERQSWQAVKRGELDFVEENVHYISIHGPLYDQSFGDITP